MKIMALGDLITPAPVVRAGTTDLPILSMTMHGGLIDQSQKFKKRVASNDLSEYKVVSRGQLVVGFPIDEGVLDFQALYENGIVSPAYGVWDLVANETVDRNYFKRFLRSPRAMAYYKARLRGSTARRRSLPVDVFLALEVPVPPLDEQRRIAAILDCANELCIRSRRVIDQFDSLALSIFYDMFGDPIRNPKGWPVRPFEDVIDAMQYGPRFYNESYSPHGVKIVRITDLDQHGHLDFNSMPRMDVSDDELKKFCLTAGDIVFARTGATVGKLAVIRDGDPACIAGAYFIRIRLKDNAEPDYVATALRSRSIQSIIVSGSHQSAQQNFSGPGLRALHIPIPPTDMQRQFSSLLTGLAERAAPSTRAASELDALFASLQSRAFSGHL